MGYALATAAARRGARTILISGPTRLEPPADVEFISVRSSEQMQRAVLEQLPQATVVIMAAAVADFRPVAVHPTKIKRGNGRIPLELESTPDILADVARAGRGPHGRILVGFAAETDHVAEHARAKLEGAGFNHDTNVITLYSRDGSETPFPRMSKAEAAQRILDRVLELRRTGRQVPATHSGR
jgi:phosphopantothenoylcysteine decarboxylase/phosphopantothenate--cysteine ligase